jgi:ribosomal protein S18 acetylase RimI-like enzyme
VSGTPHVENLGPLGLDVETAEPLLREAIEEASRRAIPMQDPVQRVQRAIEQLRSGKLEGRLHWIDGRADGIAVWESGHPAGLHLEILYVRPPASSPVAYRNILEAIQRECGPIALVPGGFAGLAAGVETALMRDLAFATFGRSEMRFPPESPEPSPRPPTGIRVRPMRLEDEAVVAALHAAAFAPSFDFFLFQVDRDPIRDSELAVRDMLGGRYGEFLSWASFVAESDGGEPRGASVFVRAPYGPLLVSVHVDPAHHGRGIGEALVVSSVRALRSRGESVIALNVTEGNRRAIALYERLGFVRSIGPEWGWYSRTRIPTPPEGSSSRPETGPSPSAD